MTCPHGNPQWQDCPHCLAMATGDLATQVQIEPPSRPMGSMDLVPPLPEPRASFSLTLKAKGGNAKEPSELRRTRAVVCLRSSGLARPDVVKRGRMRGKDIGGDE